MEIRFFPTVILFKKNALFLEKNVELSKAFNFLIFSESFSLKPQNNLFWTTILQDSNKLFTILVEVILLVKISREFILDESIFLVISVDFDLFFEFAKNELIFININS